MSEFLIGLFPVLLPILVGSLTTVAFEGLQNLIGIIDALPAWAKQLSVVLIAYVLTAGGAALGVVINPDLAMVTPEELSALFSAGIAFIFHQGDRARGALS